MRIQKICITTLFSLSVLLASNTVYSARDPEKESVRIAGGLKPLTNQDWTSIAGTKASERYEIARGDTLWDISGRLFGDVTVWPKIWEINNSVILNPHMIEPRMRLLFNAGTASSLPSLTLKNSGTMTVTNHYAVADGDHPGAVWDERTPMPSREWKNLARQSWENIQTVLPANIDKDGFDSKNRIYLTKPATGLDLPQIAACKKIKPLGSIVGTRSISNYVYRGSEVTIQAEGTPLEAGKVYTLLEPEPLTIESGNRSALSYQILGRVKVLGVQNGIFVGEILNIRFPVARGAVLIPEIAKIEKTDPVASSKKIKGSLIADRRTGAFMSGANKWVYIDRGTRDGAEKGMIFRIFQNQDPKNGKKLTSGEVFVQGDVQILQGCEDFSVGMFLWSRGEVPEKYEGETLTDVSDEKVRFYFNGSAGDLLSGEIPDLQAPEGVIDGKENDKKKEETASVGPSVNPEILTPAPDPVVPPPAPAPITDKPPGEADDWLDKLDNKQELKSEEENELQQLEKFKENQAQQELPPAPAEEATPPAFPAEEPVVEAAPAVEKAPIVENTPVLKAPAKKSAKAPAAPEELPIGDDESTEGLTPL